MKTAYGSCVGVTLDGKVLSSPHYYFDGNLHELYSDSICSECLNIRKEYLNKRNENQLRFSFKEKFNEKDLDELENLALKMYGVK